MILNPITKKWLDAFINRPVSSLMIQTGGDLKIGLDIAKEIHSQLIKSKRNPLNNLDFRDQKSIGIDDVRDIQKSLTLKADKTEGISRIVPIESAERLTPEAQNALLKLIEELPDRTIIILIVNSKDSLLQTIQSRCFMLPVLSITESQAISFGENLNVLEQDIKKAYIMSEGQFSVFEQLLSGNDTQYSKHITIAKEFIQASVFERQKKITEIQKSDSIEGFINALSLTAKSGMRLSKTLESKNRWKQIIKLTLESQNQLKSNVNTKLVLLNLSVSFP